uniref:Uncharacterized protein n=1 Tax=Arundo donax TaxID=35708 RepID=A0A0A9ETM4_ARUDO
MINSTSFSSFGRSIQPFQVTEGWNYMFAGFFLLSFKKSAIC